ncbi:MAG: alternative ribosome rescue aminoacyl-tRNA hydrolase ArfB [Bacteroidota bacterium]
MKRNFDSEFKFRTSRSSGAGGQHVNTTETKVELVFKIDDSSLLNEMEKEKLLKKWPNRVNEEGEFKICSSQHRSQSANKEHVIKKFYLMLEKALKKEKKRIPTKAPKEVKEAIRKKKELHSQKKAGRKFNPKNYM